MSSNGLTGILRPNGAFLSCDYGQHGKIAIQIPEEEGPECIYFSSTKDDSILYLCDEITNEQYLWIMKNINKFDAFQYNIWSDYIRKKLNLKRCKRNANEN